MKQKWQSLLIIGALMTLLLLDTPSWVPAPVDFVGEAAAIIGRPLTPLSYAGVARRTSRRAFRRGAVYTTGAAAGAATVTYTTAQPPAPVQPASPPIGTVVDQLPPGCVPSPRGGVEYYNCGGVFYRPVVQGNNLVYMVEHP